MNQTITKSVRLSSEESEELARLSEQTFMSEASLLKKWVLAGIESQKLEMAIQKYMQRKVDLRGGAILADVSYNRFLREVESRNIIILEDDRFLERLANLANLFEDDTLPEVIAQQVMLTSE
jgi:predicted HTH domain antitoxin